MITWLTHLVEEAHAPLGFVRSGLALALALIAALWRSYFKPDDDRSTRAVEEAKPEGRPRLALFAFGYAFVTMMLMIVPTVGGLKDNVPRGSKPASDPV